MSAISGGIVTLENDILPELREQLAWLTRSDYKPSDNADHEYRDQDIEDLIAEICEHEADLQRLTQRLLKIETLTANARPTAIKTAQKRLAADPLFLDSETTGLTEDDEIVEIAITDANGAMLLNTLIKPTKPIGDKAQQIHGIGASDVADAPSFADIAPDLHRLIENRLVLIYNSAFDIRMLAQSARAHGIEVSPVADWGCAMLLYAKFYGDYSDRHRRFRWQSLTAAARQCGIELPATLHRAAADAELTRLVLRHVAESRTEYNLAQLRKRAYEEGQLFFIK